MNIYTLSELLKAYSNLVSSNCKLPTGTRFLKVKEIRSKIIAEFEQEYQRGFYAAQNEIEVKDEQRI